MTCDGDGQGGLTCCDSWGHRVGHDWATELTDSMTYDVKSLHWIICYFAFFGKFGLTNLNAIYL